MKIVLEKECLGALTLRGIAKQLQHEIECIQQNEVLRTWKYYLPLSG